MNKKYQKLVPIGLIAAVIIAIAVMFFMGKPAYESWRAAQNEAKMNNEEKAKLAQQVAENDRAQEVKDAKLKNFKPIYVSTVNGDNLGIFGTMFEDVIRTVQMNGLMIRSIEYDMKPAADPLYKADSQNYNVCELKFYFVSTYSQMQAFLNDMNVNFDYLTSISNLAITAFPENPNYLLIKASITLYSQKPGEKA